MKRRKSFQLREFVQLREFAKNKERSERAKTGEDPTVEDSTEQSPSLFSPNPTFTRPPLPKTVKQKSAKKCRKVVAFQAVEFVQSQKTDAIRVRSSSTFEFNNRAVLKAIKQVRY